MLRAFIVIATSFFKVGLLTIGGGLVIIPLLEAEMTSRGWLDAKQFLDILGIAQSTPGPIGVNTATFVGYRVIEALGGGHAISLLGALVATLSVSAPSVICVHFGGGWFERNRERPWVKTFFRYVRPLVALFVTWAGIKLSLECFQGTGIALVPCLVALLGVVLTMSGRFSPLWSLAIGGVLGLLLQ